MLQDLLLPSRRRILVQHHPTFFDVTYCYRLSTSCWVNLGWYCIKFDWIQGFFPTFSNIINYFCLRFHAHLTSTVTGDLKQSLPWMHTPACDYTIFMAYVWSLHIPTLYKGKGWSHPAGRKTKDLHSLTLTDSFVYINCFKHPFASYRYNRCQFIINIDRGRKQGEVWTEFLIDLNFFHVQSAFLL